MIKKYTYAALLACTTSAAGCASMDTFDMAKTTPSNAPKSIASILYVSTEEGLQPVVIPPGAKKDVTTHTTQTDTVELIPAQTIPGSKKTIYEKVQTADCGPKNVVKGYENTPAKTVPATEKTVTHIVTETTVIERQVNGGLAVGAIVHTGAGALQPHTVSTAQKVVGLGDISEGQFEGHAIDSTVQQITRGINDVVTPFANVAGAALIADGIRDSASDVTANGGDSESTSNAEGGQGGQAYAEGGQGGEGGKAFSNSESKSFSNANAQNNNLNVNKNYNQNNNLNVNKNYNENNNLNLNKNEVDVRNPSRPGNGSHGGRPTHRPPSNDGCTR